MSSVNQSIVLPMEKYQALMENFNAKLSKKDQEENMEVVDGDRTSDPAQPGDEEDGEFVREEGPLDPTELGRLLPVKMKVGGVKLAKYLLDHSILDWDKYGRITSDSGMENTNITDVVRDALSRGSKKANEHMNRFYYDLGKNSIIPYALIRNPKRLEEMKKIRGDMVNDSSSHHVGDNTPDRSAKAKASQTVKRARAVNGKRTSSTAKKQKQSSHLGWCKW